MFFVSIPRRGLLLISPLPLVSRLWCLSIVSIPRRGLLLISLVGILFAFVLVVTSFQSPGGDYC